MGRHDLTNAQWAKLEPLLPAGKKSGRPPVHTKRQLIDGIRWRTRAGAPWRDVPERYGPWGTAHGGRCTDCSAVGSGTAPGTRAGLLRFDQADTDGVTGQLQPVLQAEFL
ncbi:transposase [Streptomyces malaysiensis]|uniref:transposase n=1 Tax=Streptomyces malaysiensis TaxID=92644 RepID=UPI0036F33457